MHERRCYVNNDNVAYFKHDLEVAKATGGSKIRMKGKMKKKKYFTHIYIPYIQSVGSWYMYFGDGQISCNVDDVIRQMNKTSCKNLHMPRGEIHGRGFFIAHYFLLLLLLLIYSVMFCRLVGRCSYFCNIFRMQASINITNGI